MAKISDIKNFREYLDYTHIVVIGIFKDGRQEVSTHGKTRVNAKQAADMGNNLKKQLGWPEEYCNAEPLERICQNCDYGRNKKLDGQDVVICYHKPELGKRLTKDPACIHFEPNK